MKPWRLLLVVATSALLLSGSASSGKDGGPKILLAGDDLSAWREERGNWQVVGEAVMHPTADRRINVTPGTGIIVNGPKGRTVNLFSNKQLGDVQAHIEFMVPRKSNSGIYFMGRYELQIFDSWGIKEPGFIDCGAIYARGKKPHKYEGHPPRVNATRKPGCWQTFDVVFRAPRFDENGKKTANARFEKVYHNGILVHDNVEVTGPTTGFAFPDEKPTGPLMLQGDHGAIAYRNIWVRELR